MTCLTEGKHRGIEKAIWEQSTAWLQRKKPRAESRKIHQAAWLRQWKAVERDERMETSFSRSSFLIALLLPLTPPHLPSLRAATARWDCLVSAAQFFPRLSQHHLGIHTANGVCRCACHSGVCAILDLLFQVWSPVWLPWHCTCIKTSCCSAESARILPRAKHAAGRDDWAFITGVHTGRTISQTATGVLNYLWGASPHFLTAFNTGQLSIHTSIITTGMSIAWDSFPINIDKPTHDTRRNNLIELLEKIPSIRSLACTTSMLWWAKVTHSMAL